MLTEENGPASPLPNSLETFRKRTGTTDRGRDYEHLFITQCVLKLLADENIEEFYISSNDKSYGAFDDVVIQVKCRNEIEYRTIAFQLKHKQTKGYSLRVDALTAKTGDFSLKRYYDSYKENDIFSRESVLMILFTNCKDSLDKREKIQFDFGEGPFEVNISKVYHDPLLYMFCNKSSYNLISTTQCEKFFENFVISTKQENVTEMEKNIKTLLNKMFGREAEEKGFDEFYNFICKWSMKVGEKDKLNQTWMRRVLTMSVLFLYVKPLSFDSLQIPAKAEILQSAFIQFSTIFIGKQNYGVLKTLWRNVINEIDCFEYVRALIRKYQINIKNIDELDLCQESVNVSKLVWLLGKCPLVVDQSEVTSKALEFHTEGRFVILTDSPESHTIFENSTDKQTLRSLKDLKNDQIFQKLLENFTYSLDGQKESSLKYLLDVCPDMEDSIKIKDLIEMLDGPLIIGESQLKTTCYIERFLRKDLIDAGWLNQKNKNCIVAVGCVENCNSFVSKFGEDNIIIEFGKIDLQLQNEDDRTIICVKDTNYSTEDFKLLCSKYSTRASHLFRYVNENFEWIVSTNSGIPSFENHRRKSKIIRHSVSESQLLHFSDYNKIGVVCANPGMGKSSLMMNLKRNTSSEDWTILLHARNTGFYLQKSGRNIDKFLEYLLDTIHSDDVTKAVFKCHLENNRYQIIWDGCDEATGTSMEFIFDMVEILKKKGIKQWLTSRKNLKDTIEKRLSAIAFDLEQFNEDEQRDYIKQRVQVPNEEINDIFKKIKNNIALFSNNDILGIPLQIYMLTELFLANKDKYLQLLDDMFNLSDLYSNFIEQKFEIYYSEKLENNLQIDKVQEMFQNEKKSKYKYYKQAALKIYFPENKITKFVKGFFPDKYLLKIGNSKNYSNFIDDLGLIVRVSKDNIPEFAHSSYGEYFVALYLSENDMLSLQNAKFMSDETFINIRFFLDLILASKSKAHVAVLYKNCALLDKCTNEDLDKKDKSGRSVLEVSCKWTLDYPAINIFTEDIQIGENYSCVSYKNVANTNKLINIKNNLNLKKIFILMPFVIPLYNKGNWFINTLTYSIIFDYHICLNYFESQQYFLYITKNEFEEILKLAIKFRAVRCLNKILEREMFPNFILENRSVISKFCNPIFDEIFTSPVHKKLVVSLLHYCCRNSYLEQIYCFLTKGLDILDAVDLNGNLPIHIACTNKDAHSSEVVELLLTKGARIDVADANGNLPISLVCMNESPYSYKKLELFLLKGAPINTPDANGNFPIHLACLNESPYSYKKVKLLLVKGASVDVADANGTLPIHLACMNEGPYSYEKVELLLSNGASMDTTDTGLLPIHLVCMNKSYYSNKIVELLLSKGASTDKSDACGNLPIHLTCSNESPYSLKKLELLLSTGTPTETADMNGNLPIHLACMNESPYSYEKVELLLSKGASLDTANENGLLPIHYACMNESYNSDKIVKLLLSKGAFIDRADSNGNLPIHLVCLNKSDCSYETLKLLLSKGAPINKANATGNLLIHLACMNEGHYSNKIVELLLSKGALMDIADESGNLPIHLACNNTTTLSYEKVKLLLSKGAPINTADGNGNFPIHLACMNKSYRCDRIVSLLLSKSVAIDIADANGNLPIHLACINESDCSYETVELLLSKGASVDRADANGNLPIHLACMNKNRYSDKIVKLLVSKGAAIDQLDANGNLPIHLACANENDCSYDMIKLLLSNGARIDRADANGNLPIYLASMNKSAFCDKIVELLLSEGASRMQMQTKT